MVAGEFLTLTPRFPELEELDPEQVGLTYDRKSDTLSMYFYGPGRPAISIEARTVRPGVDEHIYYRVDLDTEQVIGTQIEAFLRVVVRRYPSLIDLLEFAGMKPGEIQKIREQIAPETRKQAAMSSLFGQLIPTAAAS